MSASPESPRPAVAESASYVPAAGREAFTRLYDPVMALTMREGRFRALLGARIAGTLPEGGRVVDVGAGTGTFAIRLAAEYPTAEVIAVDGDSKALEIAGAKDGSSAVRWLIGMADGLALEDESVDAVVISLLLHHLERPAKMDALGEARRVLRPGGRLHIADWGRPRDPLMKATFVMLQALDGYENTRDHAAGRIPALVEQAGFASPETYARLRTAWGQLELIEAARGR